MATTGKNKKQKSKAQTMSLQSFLAKDSENIQAGYSIVTAKRGGIDWAAEAEREGPDEDDHPDVSYSGRDHQQYILPSAPMGPNIDMGKVPTSPPFTAFIGGLSYDIEQEDIRDFFKKLKVTSIRIPRSTAGETERFRGFGYVEFEDRQSLIDALAMNETFFKSGRVKIDIAENQNDPNRRRDKSDRSDRNDPVRTERMVGNWRSAPREEPVRPERSFRDDQEAPRDRFGGDRDRDRDRYGSRGFDRGQNDRESGGGGGFRDRGYGNFSRGGSDRSFGGDRDRQRDNGSDRGFDRGSRGGGRREYGGGYERRNDDRQDYGGSRSNWGSSNYERPERNEHHGENAAENEREAEVETPRERPKLVIKPRTKPLEEAGAPVAASAIFGGAKPVDTAARERQIEQRLAKEKELAASRPLSDNRVRDAEKESQKEESREDSRESHELVDSSQRRSSTGSHRSSTSVPPSSVRSWDGGASGQSETDEEKEKEKPPPAVTVVKPPSPRREDSKAVPAPPPKENAWAKRSTVQQRPPSSGERSKSTDTEKENRHSNSSYSQQRSSSVSSTGSDDKPHHGSSADSHPPKRDDAGYGQKSDDNVFRGRGERGGPRGGRVATRGSGRGYGDRRGGQDSYSRDNSENSGRNNDRPRDERPKEMPKFVEPEIPSYTSSNKFTQLMTEEYDD